MPPAFVQSKGGTSNTLNSLGIAFTSNNTVGNLLVCAGVVNASTLAGLTITDSQGNAWTIALQDNWKSLSTFFMAYAPNCKAGANTVTITQLGSLISGAISEYSGVSTTTPLDEAGFSDSGSGTWTAATSGNVTTRENGELIVAAQGNSTGPASVTLGSGFSNLQDDSGNFVSLESQVQATAGAIAGTFTISASSGACGVLTFVPTSETAFNVWKPQGNVLPSSLVSGSLLANPSVIYEGSPVVLTGATNVFKIWVCSYSGPATAGIYYFESLDGLTSWTPSPSNPIITDVSGNTRFPTVYKVGSTYYLYAGDVNLAVWTSTDGVTFTSKSFVLNNGGFSSTWYQNGSFQPNLCDVISGTWYMYITGVNNSGNPKYTCGLFTSTDGLTFTQVSGNPNLTTTNPVGLGAFNFFKVGSTYYAYTSGGTPNAKLQTLKYEMAWQFSAPSPSGPWTPLELNGNIIPPYYAGTPADFGTGLVGQTTNPQIPGDPHFCFALGNVYLYYDMTVDAGIEFGIGAAVAYGTTGAQLVSTYGGVFNAPFAGNPQLNLNTLASDSASGANANPIGGNWTPRFTTTPFGPAQRLSNQFIPGSLTQSNADSFYNALTWAADQWSQVTVAACGTTHSFVGVTLRNNTSNVNTGYRLFWNGASGAGTTGTWTIAKIIAGSSTTLASGTGMILGIGDTLMGVVIGTTIILYWNGFPIGSATDSSITNGSPGFLVADNNTLANAAVTNWSGGTFQDAPALTASISGNVGVGGATVTYSGAASGSVTADSFGNYILPGLASGSYTITPSLANYIFSPISASQTLSGTNITGVNFSATKTSKGSGDAGSFAFDYSFG
jgi:hypothetical protein